MNAKNKLRSVRPKLFRKYRRPPLNGKVNSIDLPKCSNIVINALKASVVHHQKHTNNFLRFEIPQKGLLYAFKISWNKKFYCIKIDIVDSTELMKFPKRSYLQNTGPILFYPFLIKSLKNPKASLKASRSELKVLQPKSIFFERRELLKVSSEITYLKFWLESKFSISKAVKQEYWLKTQINYENQITNPIKS